MVDPRRVQEAFDNYGLPPYALSRTVEWVGGWVDGICGLLENKKQVEDCVRLQLGPERIRATYDRGKEWENGVRRFAGLMSPSDPAFVDVLSCAMLSEMMPEMLPDSEVARDKRTVFTGCMAGRQAARQVQHLYAEELLTR